RILCTSCCVPRSVRARLLQSRKADRAPGEFDSESYGGDVLAGGVLHPWVRHEPEYFRIAASIENNSVTFVVECECQREAATGKSASTRVSRRQTRVS